MCIVDTLYCIASAYGKLWQDYTLSRAYQRQLPTLLTHDFQENPKHGLAERWNRTLLGMLATSVGEHPKD